jgi:DNA-binding FadR family transcriptional regulator
MTLEEHESIVTAVEKNDPKAAERAMRIHLTRANAPYGK